MKSIATLFSLAFILHYHTSILADSDKYTTDNTFYMNATHLRLLPKLQQIHANKGLFLRTPYVSVYGDSATLYANLSSIIIENPRLELSNHQITIGGHLLAFSNSTNAFHIHLPHVVFQKPHFNINGLYGSCQAEYCEFFDTIISLCSDTHSTIFARKVFLHKSQYIDLYDVQFSRGRHHLVKLHFLRLSPTNKAGFTAPIVGFSNSSGFILGSGGIIPVFA